MKATCILPPLILATAVLAATDYENAVVCGKINPSINTAISQFCDKKNSAGQLTNDLVVPSDYATKGVHYKGVWVGISGNCKPPQWVPLEWCAPQFHEMCANGDSSGSSTQKYGNNDCQTFTITGKVDSNSGWGKRDEEAEEEKHEGGSGNMNGNEI